MFKRRLLVMLGIVSLFMGCATSSYSGAGASSLPDALFDRARSQSVERAKLEKLKKPSKAEIKRRAKLRDEQQKFEHRVIQKAISLEQQDDWEAAEELLWQANRVVPSSQALRTARMQFDDRRTIRQEVIRAELAIHQGEQLMQNASAYESLQRVASVKFLGWIEVKAYKSRRADSAKKLEDFADKALAREDYYLARRCLSLSHRLQNDKEVKKKLKLADAYIKQVKKRNTGKSSSRSRWSINDNADAELLVGEIHHALQKNDFLTAKRELSNLRRQYPDYRGLVSINSQYGLQLDRHINNVIEEGKVLYSEGAVEEALKVWQKIKPLAPNHVELLSSIARAEKVLQNLRMLKVQDSSLP